MYPDNLLYSKEHEWVLVDGDQAVIGITQHAQEQLGDIVYVELPEVGAEFDAGEELGSLESVKAVAEVFMPMAGEITAINEALEDAPETVNDSPHENGWLVKFKMKDTSALDGLMKAAAYQEFVAQE